MDNPFLSVEDYLCIGLSTGSTNEPVRAAERRSMVGRPFKAGNGSSPMEIRRVATVEPAPPSTVVYATDHIWGASTGG